MAKTILEVMASVAKKEKVLNKNKKEADFTFSVSVAKNNELSDILESLNNVFSRVTRWTVFNEEKNQKKLESAISKFIELCIENDSNWNLQFDTIESIVKRSVAVQKTSKKDVNYDLKGTSYNSFIYSVCLLVTKENNKEDISFKTSKKLDKIEKDEIKKEEAENNEEKSIGNMNSKELKEYCKKLGLKGYSKLGKDALLDMIKASQRTQTEQEETVA